MPSASLQVTCGVNAGTARQLPAAENFLSDGAWAAGTAVSFRMGSVIKFIAVDCFCSLMLVLFSACRMLKIDSPSELLFSRIITLNY